VLDPLLRIVTMIDPHSHLALRAQKGPFAVREPTRARPLLEQFPQDSLLLIDMGLCGYEALARISAQGGRRSRAGRLRFPALGQEASLPASAPTPLSQIGIVSARIMPGPYSRCVVL
jgi:hypothetical protein